MIANICQYLCYKFRRIYNILLRYLEIIWHWDEYEAMIVGMFLSYNQDYRQQEGLGA